MLKVLKTGIIAVMILAMMVAMVIMPGCKTQQGTVSVEEKHEITVTDGEGNVVEMDMPAEKVIVFAPSVLEIIDGLGAMDKVSEIDNFTVMMQGPLAEGFEGVGDYQSLNIERITELDPDIVIAIAGGPDDDYQKIRDLGIPIYRVIDVRGIEGVYEEISNIGKLIGFEDEAAVMANTLEAEIDAVSEKVKDLSDEEKFSVFYEVWNDPLMSVGSDTFLDALISLAGGKNIVAEDGLTGWPEYSIETLIQRNPDVVIAPASFAFDPTIITGDERFVDLDAVINNKVFIVPDNPVSRPSQNLIKGLQMLAKAIHPEIFGEFEIIE